MRLAHMTRYLTFILLFITVQVGAQDWKLAKNEDGIKVYTRPNQSSSFDSFKAIMMVDYSVDQVTEILMHTDEHRDMYPNSRDYKVLKRPSDSTLIQYSVSETPWPVDDRDGIYEMVFKTERKTGVFNVFSRALPTYLPEKEDIVRITLSDTRWTVTPKGDSKALVEYMVTADPGGSIPSWLANSAAVDVPFQTFVNLRKELDQID